MRFRGIFFILVVNMVLFGILGNLDLTNNPYLMISFYVYCFLSGWNADKIYDRFFKKGVN